MPDHVTNRTLEDLLGGEGREMAFAIDLVRKVGNNQ
jgi:hypothetical protein